MTGKRMIDHLEEGEMQALLDGELRDAAAADAHYHLAVCGICSAGVDELRRASIVLASAIPLLDGARGPSRAVFIPPSTLRGAWVGAMLPRAAVLLLGFTTAAAAVIPGSPLRGWLADQLTPAPRAVTLTERVEDRAPTPSAVDAPVQSGISVEPERGRLRIVLTRPASNLRIRALIVDAPRGGAYAVGDSANARFRSEAGTVEVIEASGGELRLEIPSLATSATVELDGRLYLTKEGDQLRLMVASDDTAGAEVLFRPR
jgi:hypothetical protein